MGLFRRRSPDSAGHSATEFPSHSSGAQPGAEPPPTKMTATILEGHASLEVVGESYHQDNLWRLVGGHSTSDVRHPIVAVLIVEDNPYDANAIAVWIDRLVVGYLPRDIAANYRPGLIRLMKEHGHPIALSGLIIGGGIRDHGIGMLGVFLKHDPADFVEQAESTVNEAHVRTGAHEIAGHGGLGWRKDVPEDNVDAISHLRHLLVRDRSPIDRHFIYSDLEHRLYHSRDAFTSALADYDEVCRQHDAEMDGIVLALRDSLGGVPLLDTYRQACIRHQHSKTWEQALWWAKRGLSLYGGDALNPEFPAYLEACRDRYTAQNELPRTR